MSVTIQVWLGAMGLIVTMLSLIMRITWKASERLTGMEAKLDGLTQDWATHQKEDERRFDEHGHRLTVLEAAETAHKIALLELSANGRMAEKEAKFEVERLRSRFHQLASEVQSDRNRLALQIGRELPAVRIVDDTASPLEAG